MIEGVPHASVCHTCFLPDTLFVNEVVKHIVPVRICKSRVKNDAKKMQKTLQEARESADTNKISLLNSKCARGMCSTMHSC